MRLFFLPSDRLKVIPRFAFLLYLYVFSSSLDPFIELRLIAASKFFDLTGKVFLIFVPVIKQRGRQVYHEGESASGTPMTVVVSQGGTPISASFLPCSGCHGKDGKGRPEGGS